MKIYSHQAIKKLQVLSRGKIQKNLSKLLNILTFSKISQMQAELCI